MSADRAVRLAAAIYEKSFAGHPGFSRFIASSLWRPFSQPPQDWPLAVCDGTSVGDDEGIPNVMVRLAELPDPDNIPAHCEDEDKLPAASIFYFSPKHRWWYFPDMTRDEVLLVKFHDSDHSKAWRTPHTSFRDPRVQNAAPRESIEFRTISDPTQPHCVPHSAFDDPSCPKGVPTRASIEMRGIAYWFS
jgi:hypothetical protein